MSQASAPEPLRYVLGERLGEGAFGVVYRARHRLLGTEHAVKVLSHARVDLRARLLREDRLQGRIRHPNVVAVTDLVDVDGAPGLVMEYVQGPTLAALLRQRRPTPAQLDDLAAGLFAGVGAAHALGMVHRDLKPDNILLARRGDRLIAKVADFGIARLFAGDDTDSMTRTGAAMGTPAYMAPEQFRDAKHVDQRADIWALGCVLYEMVCGSRAFVGADFAEIFQAVLGARFAPPRQRRADIEPRWEAAILAALRAHPGDRPASCEDLRALWGPSPAAGASTWDTATLARVDEMAAGAAAGRETSATWATGAPSASTLAPRHNLPRELDTFVGREADLTALAETLAAPGALVTVVGTGGLGKTRLVRRFGREQLADWPGGVWFCDLSEARSAEGICFAVAQALGVPLSPKQDPVVQLGHAIAGRGRCLVILDNFEQVTEHAPATTGRWHARAAEASFVVTSREVLGLPGEQVLALDALPLPPEEERDPARLRDNPAVALFVSRAHQAKRSFALTGSNAGDVAELARLLEGLPLAIELAAARARTLTPSALRARMSQRFRLLAGGRGRPGRQATLRAAIDWSWSLLAPWEQAAFAQCSVFEGGFTLDAVEAALDLSAWPDAPWAMDVVQALVDKSLVRTWLPAGEAREPRFGMYISLQEYAREKLAAAPVEAASARSRHAEYFGAMGRDDDLATLTLRGGLEARHRLSRELDNLVAGAKRTGEDAAGRCCLAAIAVLRLVGPFAVGAELAEDVLGRATLSASVARRLLLQRGNMLHLCGQMEEARALLQESLAAHRSQGDRRGEGRALESLGNLHAQQGNMEEARAHYEHALAAYREVAADRVGDRSGEGTVLGNLGLLHMNRGHMEEARDHYERALVAHREIGDRSGEGTVLGSLGILHKLQGRIEEARVHYERALEVFRQVGNRRFEGIALGNLGLLHMDQGRMEEARAPNEDALAVHRQLATRRSAPHVLGNLGLLHMSQGRAGEARARYEDALEVHREVGDPRGEGTVLANLANLATSQGLWGVAAASLDRGEALLRDVDDKVELGKLLCRRGHLQRRQGHLPEAAHSLAEADALAQTTSASPESELGHAIAALREALADDEHGASVGRSGG